MIVDWLTLVTEFVGMTAALAIFGVPPWLTVVAVIVLMAVIVLKGRYCSRGQSGDLLKDSGFSTT